jgi:hypothetical protein
MPKRIEFTVSDAELERLDRDRGLVSRSAWVRYMVFPPTFEVTSASPGFYAPATSAVPVSARRIEESVSGEPKSSGAAKDGVPSPARSSVAEQAAAPSSSVMARSSEKALSMVPGVVRGSSLAKSGVRPIPKGKGK